MKIPFIKRQQEDYSGAIVLGLNDALVEILGVLTGLTFVLTDSTTVASAGLVTGIAASLSMAASNFLAVREDERGDPLKAAFYTGGAYLVTVVFLVLPYILLNDTFVAWRTTLVVALLLIAVFNAYIARLRKVSFLSRFMQMVLVSFGVAFLSYLFGVFLDESLLG